MLEKLSNLLLKVWYYYIHYFTIPIFIDITDKCNRECPFCYKRRDRLGRVITTDLIDTILAKLQSKDLKVKIRVILFGGEPTLEPELCKYTLSKCKEYGISVGLFTNGWWVGNNDYNWIFDDKYSPSVIYYSINDYLPNSVKNFYTLSKLCSFNKTALLGGIIGNYSTVCSFGKKNNHIMWHWRLMTNDASTFCKDSVDNCCIDEGINILTNGDTYISCDMRCCKLRGLDYLIHDLNCIPKLRKRMLGKYEVHKAGSELKCELCANKVLETL